MVVEKGVREQEGAGQEMIADEVADEVADAVLAPSGLHATCMSGVH